MISTTVRQFSNHRQHKSTVAPAISGHSTQGDSNSTNGIEEPSSPRYYYLQEDDMLRFRTKVCPDIHRFGRCHRLDRCSNSHCLAWQRRNPSEIVYSPDLCPNISFAKKGDKMTLLNNCSHRRHCKFAHSKEEQLYHPLTYKTKFCVAFPNCQRFFCPFAHSQAELRSTVRGTTGLLSGSPLHVAIPSPALSATSSSSSTNNIQSTFSRRSCHKTFLAASKANIATTPSVVVTGNRRAVCAGDDIRGKSAWKDLPTVSLLPQARLIHPENLPPLLVRSGNSPPLANAHYQQHCYAHSRASSTASFPSPETPAASPQLKHRHQFHSTNTQRFSNNNNQLPQQQTTNRGLVQQRNSVVKPPPGFSSLPLSDAEKNISKSKTKTPSTSDILSEHLRAQLLQNPNASPNEISVPLALIMPWLNQFVQQQNEISEIAPKHLIQEGLALLKQKPFESLRQKGQLVKGSVSDAETLSHTTASPEGFAVLPINKNDTNIVCPPPVTLPACLPSDAVCEAIPSNLSLSLQHQQKKPDHEDALEASEISYDDSPSPIHARSLFFTSDDGSNYKEAPKNGTAFFASKGIITQQSEASHSSDTPMNDSENGSNFKSSTTPDNETISQDPKDPTERIVGAPATPSPADAAYKKKTWFAAPRFGVDKWAKIAAAFRV
eukprot:TRINITY_DN9168_c0_g1_i2.p1 TRINITY_DN9168_c0_g1~~TRINITY_DN9168_c0_g1_i2.p1  ORF type:complete len:663 (+),score=63.63 TRINITY_DN9168_c0_g1_i2:294-2282(+)